MVKNKKLEGLKKTKQNTEPRAAPLAICYSGNTKSMSPVIWLSYYNHIFAINKDISVDVNTCFIKRISNIHL
jgi:hypothetical protein